MKDGSKFAFYSSMELDVAYKDFHQIQFIIVQDFFLPNLEELAPVDGDESFTCVQHLDDDFISAKCDSFLEI